MASVLVVDDEPDIVLFVQLNLELSGHEVRTAGDGAAALASILSDPPDLVVLDLMMPVLDGWAVITALKKHRDHRVRTTPVVMLTALDTDLDQARGGIEGAVRYLTKPLTPDDLVDAVNHALEGDEPDQRRAAQREGLVTIARMERHAAGGAAPTGPAVGLSRLERPRPSDVSAVGEPARIALSSGHGLLTAKQRALLDALLAARSVSNAAVTLGMSRSNIYASLRRIGRKVGVADVSELLRLLRSGQLDLLLHA
jgi:CheY-like chemotaxis protein/DNA-binding CsgD family transcriptional regulator